MPAAPIVPDDLRTRLSRIRGLILDVDGVLTDGSMTFDEEGREWKTLRRQGRPRTRPPPGPRLQARHRLEPRVEGRLGPLRGAEDPRGVVLQGERDKAAAFDLLAKRWALEPWEIAAIGDDLPDLGMLRRAGVGAAPPTPSRIVRDAAALRLTRPGGAGAVREMCDLLLEVRRGARADRPAAVGARAGPRRTATSSRSRSGAN